MKVSTIIIFCMTCFNFLSAQDKNKVLTDLILSKDSTFWAAYNTCNSEVMEQFIADDIEFYHDKGGMTSGLENLMTITRKNLCGNENFRLRRTVVEGSVKVFPLKNNDVIYGAIVTGEHVFYVLEKGKPERLDGLAKFTHVWTLKNKDWKMSRILSYDHGPATQANHRKEIKLAENILNQFAGRYLAPQSGVCDVQRADDLLNLSIGNQKYVLYPFSNDSFFVKDRDLTFEFTDAKSGKLSRMIVRENGNIVEEAVRQRD